MTEPQPEDLAGFLAVAEYHILQAPKSSTEGANESLLAAGCWAAPRLLAAVQKVLTLHVPGVVLGAGLKGGRFDYCETCSGHPAWPCPEVQAISGALLGEGETDGH